MSQNSVDQPNTTTTDTLEDQNTDPIVSPEAKDPDMIELIERFVGRIPKRITELENAVQAQDIELLRTLAHKLKGAAGCYGFQPISEAALALETNAKAQKELEQLQQDTQKLIALCRRVRVS